MKEQMSRWGIGPLFAALSIGYGIVTLAISRYYYPSFQIDFLPNWFLYSIGIALIFFGVPFWIISVITVMRAYNANELVTKGVFKCCRHPVYASWVVFIVPGITLLMKNWLGMSAPIFMYFILRLLVKKEEIYLENVFGSQYREYKNKIPSILPIGWIKPSF